MKFSIKFDTVKSEWSMVYIEGSWVIISKKKYCILNSFSEDQFHPIKQSANPDLCLHNIKGSWVMISKKYCISFSEDQFYSSKQCNLTLIWVSTVCQSTCLGVFGLQRYNKVTSHKKDKSTKRISPVLKVVQNCEKSKTSNRTLIKYFL